MANYRVAKYSELSASEIERWRELARPVDDFSHPLLQPEYAYALDRIRPDVEIGIVEENHAAIGFLPFHRIGRHRAAPLGCEASDAHAFISSDREPDVLSWIRGFELTRFDFDHLLGIAPADFTFRFDDCYRVSLKAGIDAYLADRTSNSQIFSSTGRKKRKLEREVGDIQVIWSTPDPVAMDLLIEWKATQLLARGFANPFRHQWIVDLAKSLHTVRDSNVTGLLSGLHVNGEFAALHFGILNSDCLVSWLPCVNPKYEKYSPGTMLLIELTRLSADRGIVCIDLGRGENQAKARLANERTRMAIGSVRTSAIANAAVRYKDRCKQLIKRRLAQRNAR